MKKNYIVKYVIYFLIIALTSTYLIMLSYGYRINFQAKKIQKTSVIYLASLPRSVAVYINNKLMSDATPLRYTYIFPGYYDVKLVKDGYYDWEKSFNVIADYISQDSDIILILKECKKIDLTDKDKENYDKELQEIAKQKENKNLLVIKNGAEIFIDDKYITRLSSEIKNIAWYPDGKHIIYQADDKIFFMDMDGTNSKLLVQLPGNNKTEFMPTSEGKYLVYKYDNEINKIQITEISSIITEKYFNKAVKIIK